MAHPLSPRVKKWAFALHEGPRYTCRSREEATYLVYLQQGRAR